MATATFDFVETKEILKHLNAAKFFQTYLPHIKMYKHKMRGKDGNGKEIDFSDDEKRQIIAAVQKFASDIKPSPSTKKTIIKKK